MILVVFLFVAMLALLSLYGWGGLACRLFKCAEPSWIVRAVIGLATVIFIVGMLNLLRLCYGAALDVLALIGLIAVPIFRSTVVQPAGKSRSWLFISLIIAGVLATMGVVVLTQLPPTAFNYHDDFHKYFTHPVRMLQTGTLFGSQLSALGSETLGGQAVLQAFVLNHFSIQYIYGVDSIFGLMICLFLAIACLPARLEYLPLALVLGVFVLAVNPLMINVSSIYSGCALIMASILVYFLMSSECHPGYGSRPHALVIGLLYAALIAMKTSFTGYVVIQISLYVIMSCACREGRNERLTSCGWIVMSTLLFLAPWLLLYLPYYAGFGAERIIPLKDSGWDEPYIQQISFFSFEPSYYGPGFGLYTLLALTAASLGLVCLTIRRSRENPKPVSLCEVASCGFASGIFYMMLVSLGPQLNGYDVSLRLATPVLIAVVPILACVVVLRQAEQVNRWNRSSIGSAVVVLGMLLLTAGFAPDAVRRFIQGAESGNVLAFPGLASSEPYKAYNQDVLDGLARERIRRAQQLVPSGAPLFAWISTPFLLDFARNRIYDADQAGIGSPWSYLPNVGYYIYEYEGYAVPPISAHRDDLRFPGKHERFVTRKVLSLIEQLAQLLNRAEILYDDGGLVVFRAYRDNVQGL
jgi:hypothetical protein